MKHAVLALLAALLLHALPGQAASPVVLFDQGHGQRFAVDRKGELDLSSLAEVFREAGFEVRTSEGRLGPEQLSGVTALVSSGLFTAYDGEEIGAILAFVERGGALSVMLHVAPFCASLLGPLGVDYSNGVLNEGLNVIDGNSLNFRVTSFRPDPLTDGLERFSVYGAWALRSGSPASRPVAFTTPQSWVDVNRDGQRGPEELRMPFAVLVTGARGNGRFAVFGDDAVFQNRFLDADNRRLARNLALWMKGGQPL